MLIGSDRGLDLVLGFDDFFHNVLTETMLNQDEIFRNQVLELHRLYQIQKLLMKEVHLKASGQESPHSFVGPFPEQLKYESIATKMKLSEVHTTYSSGSVKNHSLQEHRGTLKHQQIPLDLELPASHYINDNEDLLHGSHLCIAPEVPDIMKHGLRYDEVSSICSPSRQTISLQGSAYSGDLVKFGAKHALEPSSSCRSRKDNAFNCISESHSFTHAGPNLFERQHIDQEGEQCHEDLSCKNTSARRKLFSSHEDGLLDLNKALLEESFVLQNEVGVYDEGTFLTALDWKKAKNSCFNEPSALDQLDTTNSTLTMNSSYPPSDSKDPGSCSRNFKPNVESDISLPDKTGLKMSMPEMNESKIKELLEGTNSNKSPVSCKCAWNADDISSDNKTGKCSFHKSNSNVASIQQNVVQFVETGPCSSDVKKQELAKVDIVVRKGAVSLMYFSLECSDRTQDYVPESRKRKQNTNMEEATSQSSSESYESIVLRQLQCDVDNYCVSSTSTEVTSFNEKDLGVKLRRGRRMKDFRKEILPGLASLTRQEICEDVKIMELAIRSREYKKFRSKMASRSECFSSVRSRRSRLSYVGRRNYS